MNNICEKIINKNKNYNNELLEINQKSNTIKIDSKNIQAEINKLLDIKNNLLTEKEKNDNKIKELIKNINIFNKYNLNQKKINSLIENLI